MNLRTRLEFFRPDRRPWLFALLLAAAVLLAYQPIWHAGFIWDDNLLIVENPLVQGAGGWWKAWGTKVVDYVPGVTSGWWVEWRLWQNYPPAFHLVNLGWHILAALLLWRVLRRLPMPGAWLAAALFALHPVNVETAAWVAEQKSTQALFFFLAAAWCQIHFYAARQARWYVLALAAFALALSCKTAVAPFPILFLALAWWKKGKISREDFLQSLPFFFITLMAALVVLFVQRGDQGGLTAQSVGLAARAGRAGQAVWFYLGRDVWPFYLQSIYPKWPLRPASPLFDLPGLLLVAVVLTLWRKRGRGVWPWLFAIGYFLLLLSPVLGFFDISLMRYAWVTDHWQYFAIIGPLALLGYFLRKLMEKNLVLGMAVAVLILGTYGVLTWRQSRIYVSGQTFWGEFTRVNQPAMDAYQKGENLLTVGKINEAADLFRRTIELQPAFSLAYNALGEILLRNGPPDAALPYFEEAATLRPDLGSAQEGIGTVLLTQNRTAEALEHFERGAQLQPGDAGAQFRFGSVLLQLGLAPDALPYLQNAVRLQPNSADNFYELGNALQQSGRSAEAIDSYEKTLLLRQNFVSARNNLAFILATSPDPALRNGARALALAQKANRLAQGKNPIILGTLAAAEAEAGRFTEAAATGRQSAALAKASGNANLAALLLSQVKLYDAGRPLRSGGPARP